MCNTFPNSRSVRFNPSGHGSASLKLKLSCGVKLRSSSQNFEVTCARFLWWLVRSDPTRWFSYINNRPVFSREFLWMLCASSDGFLSRWNERAHLSSVLPTLHPSSSIHQTPLWATASHWQTSNPHLSLSFTNTLTISFSKYFSLPTGSSDF